MAVAVKRVVSKAKPKMKAQTSRKSKSSMLMEEKHIGSLTVDWSSFASYEEAKWSIYESLRHLSYFYDTKEAKKWAVAYAKKHLPKIAKLVEASDDYYVSASIGGQCKLIMSGAPFLQTQIDRVHNTLEFAANKAVVKQDAPPSMIPTISPVVRLKNKTSEFISEIEFVIDEFLSGTWLDIENYSVYNELLKIAAAPATAKDVIAYYQPLKAEIVLAISKKDVELSQSYGMSAKQLKDYQKLIDVIINDATRYLDSKKATKTTRAPKIKTVAQQVTKMKFAKESAEFKITSVDPATIVGADKMFLFDTKYRTLTFITTNNASGFVVKGTTISNIDYVEKKRLRKPDEAISEVLKCTKAKSNGVFNAIKTKAAVGNGRVNENMIILKVFK